MKLQEGLKAAALAEPDKPEKVFTFSFLFLILSVILSLLMLVSMLVR